MRYRVESLSLIFDAVSCRRVGNNKAGAVNPDFEAEDVP
jgi:hypothetical protein